MHASKRASTWWDSPTVRADAVQYWTKAERRIGDWQRDTESMLDRAAPWTAPANVGNVEHDSRAPSVEDGNMVEPTRWAVAAGKTIAEVGGQRDTYYAIGKFFNYKFKPWGAVKGAAKVAKVGAVIAVVGLVFDAGVFVKDIVAEGRLENARMDITEFINDTIDKVTESLSDGDVDTPGPVPIVDEDIRRLREVREKSQSVAAKLAARHEALASRLAALEAHLSAAPIVMTEEAGSA